MKKFLLLISVIVVSIFSASARDLWKTFDMTRTTDAFTMEVPVGTNCLIVKTYGSNKRFGGKPNEDGALKSTEIYEFDDHGYFTKDSKSTYKNTYNADGLIEQRDVFVDGKQTERRTYTYVSDEKGPGVVVKTYDEDGNIKGVEGWQGDLRYAEAPGNEILYKLNKQGQVIEGTIKVTNYRQEINIQQSATYNDHGVLESSTLEAPGRTQVTSYSDYIYDDNGQWIQRYSDQKLTKRQILSKEEYLKFKENERAEAERKRLEKLAEETETLKRTIAINGYVPTSELAVTPTIKMKLAENIQSTYLTNFKVVIPGEVATVEWPDGVTINVERPAQLKFPNDSVGFVPSLLCGKFYSNEIINKRFSKPIEVKIDINKKTNEWLIKDSDKLSAKYDISHEEIDALNEYIAENGKNKGYSTKKLYLSQIFQLSITFEPTDDSAVDDSVSETFPIRFDISETKGK